MFGSEEYRWILLVFSSLKGFPCILMSETCQGSANRLCGKGKYRRFQQKAWWQNESIFFAFKTRLVCVAKKPCFLRTAICLKQRRILYPHSRAQSKPATSTPHAFLTPASGLRKGGTVTSKSQITQSNLLLCLALRMFLFNFVGKCRQWKK